ncbi:endonuclease domain-containing protein [Pandoraea sputorum]
MLKPQRTKMLREQNNTSPITGLQITDPVLDHCHKTGCIRAVLNRWENAVLGRLENWASRLGGGVDPIRFLRGVADYLEFHQQFPSNVLHPTYKTEDQKRDLRNKKAREARRKARIAGGCADA